MMSSNVCRKLSLVKAKKSGTVLNKGVLDSVITSIVELDMQLVLW